LLGVALFVLLTSAFIILGVFLLFSGVTTEDSAGGLVVVGPFPIFFSFSDKLWPLSLLLLLAIALPAVAFILVVLAAKRRGG